MTALVCTCGAPNAQHVPDYELPLCSDCADKRARMFNQPSEDAGRMVENIHGVDESGKHGDGAVDWHWRPPSTSLDPVDHCDSPIVFRNQLHYQQAPPVHVPGFAPGSAKEQRRRIRTMTEDEAQRRALELLADRAPRSELAAAAGMTKDQLRRAITKRNKRR